MKKLVAEFKDFINKGDVVMVAVGLVLALYFKTIVDQVIDGVINPIIGSIFGQSDYRDIGFDMGEARLRIGMVLDAAIKFVAVAFILFLVVKAYNSWKGDDEEDAGPSEVDLLTEIRDSLNNR